MSYVDTLLAEPNLVSYWRSGEQSGQFADSKGSNPSTAVGSGVKYAHPSLIAGDTNYAAIFDGTAGWLKIPDSASLDITGEISMEAWIRPSAIGSFMTIFSKNPNNANNNGYNLAVAVDGSLRADYVTGVTDNQHSTAAGLIAIGGLYHVVATYSSSNTRARNYINGVKVSENLAFPANSVGTNALLLAIGGRSSDGTADPSVQLFNGVLDELALYNVELTTQVADHYKAGMQAFTKLDFTLFPKSVLAGVG